MPNSIAIERFARKHRRDESGCWIWTDTPTSAGYGVLGVGGGRQVLAHRFSYENFVGPIPEGLQIDHLCRVRACVNGPGTSHPTDGDWCRPAHGAGLGFRRAG